MRRGDHYPFDVIAAALTSVAGWFLVILTTALAGFCCGYWSGHRQFMSLVVTLKAMSLLPVIWLVYPTMLIAYAVTAVSLYLPLRIDSVWLRIAAIVGTFIAWAVIVAAVVEAASSNKFWQW